MGLAGGGKLDPGESRGGKAGRGGVVAATLEFKAKAPQPGESFGGQAGAPGEGQEAAG